MHIFGVDSSRMEIWLDIEPSQCLVCSLTGNSIQYGGSHKRKKNIKPKATNHWNNLSSGYNIMNIMFKIKYYAI